MSRASSNPLQYLQILSEENPGEKKEYQQAMIDYTRTQRTGNKTLYSITKRHPKAARAIKSRRYEDLFEDMMNYFKIRPTNEDEFIDGLKDVLNPRDEEKFSRSFGEMVKNFTSALLKTRAAEREFGEEENMAERAEREREREAKIRQQKYSEQINSDESRKYNSRYLPEKYRERYLADQRAIYKNVYPDKTIIIIRKNSRGRDIAYATGRFVKKL